MTTTNTPTAKPPFPFNLDRPPSVHLSVLLLCDYTFNDYFTKPLRTLLSDCKGTIDAKQTLVEAHHGISLPDTSIIKNVMDMVSAFSSANTTIKELVTEEPKDWGSNRFPGQGYALWMGVAALDVLGIGMTCIRMNNADRPSVKNLFDNGSLLGAVGNLKLGDFFQTFPTDADYHAAFSADQRAMFDDMRELGVLACRINTRRAPLPFKVDDADQALGFLNFLESNEVEFKDNAPGPYPLVNNRCWNGTSCETRMGYQCDDEAGGSRSPCPSP